jgi:hypothetical protein
LDALVAPVYSVGPATTVIRLLNVVDASDRTSPPWFHAVVMM